MEYLLHSRKGWEKKNHKYTSREWRNGKWFYVYKNGKKYNKIQDWLGVDEEDAYNKANSEYEKYKKGTMALYEKVDPNKVKKTRPVTDAYAQWAYNKAVAKNARIDALTNYKKTPLYKVKNTTTKAKKFVKSLFKKKLPGPQITKIGNKTYYHFDIGSQHGKR